MQILVGFNADEPEDYYDNKMKLSIILSSYNNTASIGSDKLSQVLNENRKLMMCYYMTLIQK